MLRHIKTIHAPAPSAKPKGQAASQLSEDDTVSVFMPKVEIVDEELDDDTF
jgi:hypothetical protein